MAIYGDGLIHRILTEEEVESIVATSLDTLPLRKKRVLVIIPDGTRTFPFPLFFRLLVKHLRERRVKEITFLIALGTHPALNEQERLNLIALREDEKETQYADVKILNHRWDDDTSIISIGKIPAREIHLLSQGRVGEELHVLLNRHVMECDHILICGPVFPHEVVGFSGGNKYFFPGISSREVIDLTHWLGALMTSYHIIGKMDTPVRAVIDRASALIPTPRSAFCSIVLHDRTIAGLYFGTPRQSWAAAAQLSSQRHIIWREKPSKKVLSVIPEQYQDLWTGAKGMYKVEPIISDGGEVILYAPHIREISVTHGHFIRQIGYHVLEYFLKQWDRFSHIPHSILAHSTHVRGIGSYKKGVEHPRIQVTLATQIPKKVCESVNLTYRDPSTIHPENWEDREEEGLLLVKKAGEYLYRLKEQASVDENS